MTGLQVLMITIAAHSVRRYSYHCDIYPCLHQSNVVIPVTSVAKASRAFFTRSFLRANSSSAESVGFPTGLGIAMVGTILLAPTDSEIVVIVAICTAGMPWRSISFTIVAPQRVQVPQVDVRITPSTPSSLSRAPISSPN